MGWLGRRSIELAVSEFTTYYDNEPVQRSSVEHSLKVQIQILEEMFPFVKKNSFSSGFVEELYEYASIISKKDAKIMASDTINVGAQLRKSIGAEASYYAHLLMGAFYQSVAELSGISSQPISRKYTRPFLLQKQCIDHIVKVLER